MHIIIIIITILSSYIVERDRVRERESRVSCPTWRQISLFKIRNYSNTKHRQPVCDPQCSRTTPVIINQSLQQY